MTTSTISAYDDLPRLMSLLAGAEKHTPSATSTLDVLWVLYDRVLNVSPATVDDPDRDRFVLSKGHGPMAYYAVLAAKGFLPESWFPTFADYDSPLGHHPDRLLVPGVEFSSGSLGHGLGAAVGLAHGLRIRRSPARVITLVGDAELDEGANAEAITYAGAVGLEALTAAVIDNQSSTHDRPGGIARRFDTEGWAVHQVDGRDHDALAAAFLDPHPDRPAVVVAHVEPK